MKSWFSVVAALVVLAGCSGSSSSTPGATIRFNPAIYVGTWTGTWTNTTSSTSDTVVATVEQNGMALTITFDMEGEVFSSENPEEEVWLAEILPGEARLVSTTSEVYGTLEGSVSDLATIVATGTDVAGFVDRFVLTGTTDGMQMTANVTITFDTGATANANAILTKT